MVMERAETPVMFKCVADGSERDQSCHAGRAGSGRAAREEVLRSGRREKKPKRSVAVRHRLCDRLRRVDGLGLEEDAA